MKGNKFLFLFLSYNNTKLFFLFFIFFPEVLEINHIFEKFCCEATFLFVIEWKKCALFIDIRKKKLLYFINFK